jgi:hypothetical protein
MTITATYINTIQAYQHHLKGFWQANKTGKTLCPCKKLRTSTQKMGKKIKEDTSWHYLILLQKLTKCNYLEL